MSGYSGEKTFAVVAETRRRWSREEKLALVSETESTSVSAIARKHGIAPSLVFRWRRELKASESAVARESGFAPVSVGVVPALPPARSLIADARAEDLGVIEIVLAGGRLVRVGRDVDVGALKRVLAALGAE
jgi:transposase